MGDFKNVIKTIDYSIKLVYKASGLMVGVYFILSIVSYSLALLNTYTIKQILDSATRSNTETGPILVWVAVYMLLAIVTQASISAQNVLYDSILKKSEHLYDCNLLSKLATLPLSIMDSSDGRNKIDDVRHAAKTVIFATFRLVRIISLIYTFIAAFLVLAKFNLIFSMIFLILIIPGIVLQEFFNDKIENLRLEQAPDVRKFCYYRWMLTDVWPSKDVRMYNLTDAIKSRYNEEKEQYLSANKKLDKAKSLALVLSELLRRLGDILFTIFLIYKAMCGDISIGDVSLYIGFSLEMSNAFHNVLFNSTIICTVATKTTKRVLDFFEIKAENDIKSCRKLTEFQSLEFRDVYFKYPHTDNYIMNGLSFTLRKNDKLSIVGINGCGKSTIIKLMLGLYEIESGEILINNYSIYDYKKTEVRALFSVLFQNYVQYPLSLRENIALSSIERIDSDREIITAQIQSGIYDDITRLLEDGLDSYMTRRFDDKGIELSKGQWQKIALSRAYFKDSPIIILDEPSAALDAESENRVFANFESVSNKKTRILISHRISTARFSSKIIVIDNGKVVEEGTHDELILHDGVYAKLYNLQREKYTIAESGE